MERSTILVVESVKVIPDILRIGANAPNEKVTLARLDFQKNWGARVIRKKVSIKPVFAI
jgi:hypothetical protein